MSRLIHLYPRVWRDRYGQELLDTLARRPVTWGDRTDLVRGAIDAHLHPGLVGSKVPVLAGAGGDLTSSQTRFPTTQFLAITSTAAFLMVAIGLLVQDPWSAPPFWGAATIIGTTGLGGVIWRSAPSSGLGTTWLARAGAFVMLCCLPLVAVVTTAGLVQGHGRITDLIRRVAEWSDPLLTTIILLAAGSLVIATGALVPAIFRRRRASATGVLFLVLGVGLLVSCYRDYIRAMSLVFAAYGLVALGLGSRRRLTRRQLVLGVGGGVMVAGLMSLTFSVTSPWSTRDGYSIRCATDAVTCARIADQIAVGVVSAGAGRQMTHMEIAADGSATACWVGVTGSDNGCWFTTIHDRPPGP